MQSQMGAFAPGKLNSRGDTPGPRAQQMRVPCAAGSSGAALLFWGRFFLSHLDAAAPLLLLLPEGESWVDVTLGEPAFEEFFCLRASLKKLPLASEVPYNLTPEFREHARRSIAGFVSGASTASAATAPAAAAEKPSGANPFSKLFSAFRNWGNKRDRAG